MKHAHITHKVFGPVWKWRLYQKCAAIFIGNIWKTDDQPVHFGYTIFNETQLQSQSCLGSRRSPGGSRNRFNHWTFLGGLHHGQARPTTHLSGKSGYESAPHKSGFDHISSCYLILVLQTQKMPKDGKPLGPKKWWWDVSPIPASPLWCRPVTLWESSLANP